MNLLLKLHFGGNISDYRNKVKQIAGVGLVNVVTGSEIINSTVDNENVRIVIINSNLDVANNELVSEVQEIIDPMLDGSGIGIAPIGHRVKIMTATKQILIVKTTLTLTNETTVDNIKNTILEEIKNYYKDLIKNEWESGKWTVRISQIENRILNIEGVLDIFDTILTLDNDLEHTGNYDDYSYRIPVINEVTIDVSN